jgi:hypothetical protein
MRGAMPPAAFVRIRAFTPSAARRRTMRVVVSVACPS